jgi:redox-sensing transcriptional repressor
MDHFPPVPELPDLPEATIARLPEYLRALHHLAETGADTVSSEGLAAVAGVSSAKLRKDLSQLGSYGTRGVGYDVTRLVEHIEHVLGLTKRRNVALIGIGNLGQALAGYAGFASRGFRISALVDVDPARVGQRLGGLTVTHLDDLPDTVRAEQIAIGVIATPAQAAQVVADRLVAAGVTSILNFAPCVLNVPDYVDVRKVDLAIELQILSFHEHRKSSASERTAGRGPVVLPGAAVPGVGAVSDPPAALPGVVPDAAAPPRVARGGARTARRTKPPAAKVVGS